MDFRRVGTATAGSPALPVLDPDLNVKSSVVW
jgi:hypothetical protein